MNRKLSRSKAGLRAKPMRLFPVLLLLMLLGLALSNYGRVEKTAAAKTTQTANSEFNPWQTIDEKGITNRLPQIVRPRAYRTLKLDRARLTQILASAPKELTASVRSSANLFSVPLPDGSDEVLKIVDSPIMEPALAARFLEIKTYSAQSTTDTTVTGRFDWTLAGFHAILFTPQGTVLIEPYQQGNTENYI